MRPGLALCLCGVLLSFFSVLATLRGTLDNGDSIVVALCGAGAAVLGVYVGRSES